MYNLQCPSIQLANEHLNKISLVNNSQRIPSYPTKIFKSTKKPSKNFNYLNKIKPKQTTTKRIVNRLKNCNNCICRI